VGTINESPLFALAIIFLSFAIQLSFFSTLLFQTQRPGSDAVHPVLTALQKGS